MTAINPPAMDRLVGRSPSIQADNGITIKGVVATTGSTSPLGVLSKAH